MADKIVDLLTLAGVFAMLALPLAVMCCWTLIGINRRRSRALKEVLAKNVSLARRLADVEALRRRTTREASAIPATEYLEMHDGRIHERAPNVAARPIDGGYPSPGDPQ